MLFSFLFFNKHIQSAFKTQVIISWQKVRATFFPFSDSNYSLQMLENLKIAVIYGFSWMQFFFKEDPFILLFFFYF